MQKVTTSAVYNPMVTQLQPLPYTIEHSLHRRLLNLDPVIATSGSASSCVSNSKRTQE
jgi:hypothetical protein